MNYIKIDWQASEKNPDNIEFLEGSIYISDSVNIISDTFTDLDVWFDLLIDVLTAIQNKKNSIIMLDTQEYKIERKEGNWFLKSSTEKIALKDGRYFKLELQSQSLKFLDWVKKNNDWQSNELLVNIDQYWQKNIED